MIEKLSLNALKYFYYVATHGSVTVAAEKLFVSQSAVSKQIKNLEHHLDIVLFDRVSKSLVLTAKGELLFSCCQHVFMRLDDCLIDLKNEPPQTKRLVLSCEPTLSMKWLIPRLVEFNQLGYGFDIVLVTAGGHVDFQGESIDLAIRRNDFVWDSRIHHEKIIDEYIVAVRNPNTEDQKTLLLSASRPHLWQELNQSQRLPEVFLSYEHLVLEHFYLCLEGCLAGLGTAVLSIYMIEKELDHQLLTLMHPPVADSSSYHLLSYAPFHEDARKVIFKQWLSQKMLESETRLLSNFVD